MEDIKIRKVCLDCVRKHLSQANILLEEFATGDYPIHFWYAIGHMAEAESECMEKYTELAALIRAERLVMLETDGYFTDFEHLIKSANELAELEKKEETEIKEDKNE